MSQRLYAGAAAAALATLFLFGTPTRVDAFGKEGHEIVGRVADKFLSKAARDAIKELLTDHQFKGLSDGRLTTWADAIKNSSAMKAKFPDNRNWHFIDLDIKESWDKAKLDPLAGKANVLMALKKFQKVLKDPSAPLEDRRFALFFIAHFVGDISQPLHCAFRDEDRGGNLQRIQLPGSTRHVKNLHQVWDTDLVRDAFGDLTLEDYSNRLSLSVDADKRKAMQKGTVEDWILEANASAKANAYMLDGAVMPKKDADPVQLTTKYMTANTEVIEKQLLRGGVRLAQFLNDTFSD